MPNKKRAATERPSTGTLRVVVHGLFVFVVHLGGYLDLLTPFIQEHVVGAGTWNHETLLQRGERYVLSMVKSPVTRPNVDSRHIFVSAGASEVKLINPNHTEFCCIRAPIPDEIKVVRALDATNYQPLLVGEGVPQNGLTPNYVPITTVLNYVGIPLGDDGKPANPVTFGDWVWSGDTKNYLHLWAEPAFCTMSNHTSIAFNQAVGMVPGLDLELNPANEGSTLYECPQPLYDLENPDEGKTLQRRCGIVPPPPPKTIAHNERNFPGGQAGSKFSNASNCWSMGVTYP
jgi:hypothetical protein